MALTDNEKIIDINLDGIERSRFRINGNPNAIVELNLSDLGIIDRLEEGSLKLDEKMSEIANLDEDGVELSETLKQIDQAMRDCVDYIFDYPVSAVCAKYGTMYDPTDGKFRYEIIIDGLTKLYHENINAEYKKIQARIKKHTDKYTSVAKKKKSNKK